MFRAVLTIAFLASLVRPALAVVESARFQSTMTSVQDPNDWGVECRRSTIQTGFQSSSTELPLDGCGISLTTDYAVPDTEQYLRLYDGVSSDYSWGRTLFTRRAPLPLGGTEREMGGVGVLTTVRLVPMFGTVDSSTSISLVERLPARNSDKPATLSLSISGWNFDAFSDATVQVFDHDTDELLLSWEPPEGRFTRNNGEWYTQEIGFDDRMGHAIRYEFTANGSTSNNSAGLLAAAFLNLPEPSGLRLAWPAIAVLGTLRRRLRA